MSEPNRTPDFTLEDMIDAKSIVIKRPINLDGEWKMPILLEWNKKEAYILLTFEQTETLVKGMSTAWGSEP